MNRYRTDLGVGRSRPLPVKKAEAPTKVFAKDEDQLGRSES